MPLLTISQAEWKAAQEHFMGGPEDPKYSKKEIGKLDKMKGVSGKEVHSFVRFWDDSGQFRDKNGRRFNLVAMANGDYLGKGGFGKVKVAQDIDGLNYAVKVEGIKAKESEETRILREADRKAEKEVLGLMKYFVGETERGFGTKVIESEFLGRNKTEVPLTKRFMERDVVVKKYTLLTLIQGKNLSKTVQVGKLTPRQKHLFALKAAKGIQELHKNNIIHCDIKGGNFMTNMEGNQITVASIDFGFSITLNPGETERSLKKVRGTEGYMAPEILSQAKYSFASDIYALGYMFKNDLGLNITDIVPGANLCAQEAGKRPALAKVIGALESELRNNLKNIIEDIDKNAKERNITPLMYALETNEDEFVLDALMKEANLKYVDKEGYNELDYALMSDNQEYAGKLIEKFKTEIFKPSEIEKDSTLITALMCRANKANLLKLINYGAYIKATDKDKKTTLMYALEYGAPFEVIDALVKRGSDLQAKDLNGNTLEHYYKLGNENGYQIYTIEARDQIVRKCLQAGFFANSWQQKISQELKNVKEINNLIEKLKDKEYRKQHGAAKVLLLKLDGLFKTFSSIGQAEINAALKEKVSELDDTIKLLKHEDFANVKRVLTSIKSGELPKLDKKEIKEVKEVKEVKENKENVEQRGQQPIVRGQKSWRTAGKERKVQMEEDETQTLEDIAVVMKKSLSPIVRELKERRETDANKPLRDFMEKAAKLITDLESGASTKIAIQQLKKEVDEVMDKIEPYSGFAKHKFTEFRKQLDLAENLARKPASPRSR